LFHHRVLINMRLRGDSVASPRKALLVQDERREADRQLPLAGEIFLDHVAHFVSDPEAAAQALTRAGFAPTSVSVQVNADPAGGAPQVTGTGNVTAMFSRGYIEFLFKTADTPLGREFDAAIGRHRGVHLVAFAADDAANEHRRLAEAGFRVRPLVDMRRPVDTGGGAGTAAFSIARVEPGEMPEGRIQILTHRTERMVWQPRWLSHPNGALGLSHVVIAVADVAEAGQRFARFIGRDAQPHPDGQTVELDRGRVDLVSADAFAQMLPDVAIPSLPFIGAYGIRVMSLTALDHMLKRADLTTRRREHDLVAIFPEALGHGAWLFAE
jgi:Glyoxalase-like domain